MHKVHIVSQKFDGTLRDERKAFLVSHTEEAVTLFSPPGTMGYDHRKQEWIGSPDGMIEIYPVSRWYNVRHIAEQKSRQNQIYVHIALPMVFEADVLHWTDMDLDYRVHLDGRIELLDAEEFEQNAQYMRFDESTIQRCLATCHEVESGLREQTYPFDYSEQQRLYNKIMAQWAEG